MKDKAGHRGHNHNIWTGSPSSYSAPFHRDEGQGCDRWVRMGSHGMGSELRDKDGVISNRMPHMKMTVKNGEQ